MENLSTATVLTVSLPQAVSNSTHGIYWNLNLNMNMNLNGSSSDYLEKKSSFSKAGSYNLMQDITYLVITPILSILGTYNFMLCIKLEF